MKLKTPPSVKNTPGKMMKVQVKTHHWVKSIYQADLTLATISERN